MKAERTSGVWSDLGLGRARQDEWEKAESHPGEAKALSNRSRVGLLLPFVQVKERLESGRSNSPVSLMIARKCRISETFEGQPFLS